MRTSWAVRVVDRLEALGEVRDVLRMRPQGALEEVGPALDDRRRRLEVVRDRGEELVLLAVEVAQRGDVLEDGDAAGRRAEGIAERRAVDEDRDLAAGLGVGDDEPLAADDLAVEDRPRERLLFWRTRGAVEEADDGHGLVRRRDHRRRDAAHDLGGGGVAEVDLARRIGEEDGLGHDVDDLAQPREAGLRLGPSGLLLDQLLGPHVAR